MNFGVRKNIAGASIGGELRGGRCSASNRRVCESENAPPAGTGHANRSFDKTSPIHEFSRFHPTEAQPLRVTPPGHYSADLAVMMPPRTNPRVTVPLRRGACSALFTALLIPALPPKIEAADPDELLKHLSIEELGSVKVDTVYTASKFTEKVTDAPSSVTIVTRDEISKFGYRTLADILRATRGYDVTYDRNYAYAGVRGYTSLDDFGSRVLLLVDGHRMNDPIYDTAAIGTDELVDVGLIERVEIIRGPGSAVYGSNAFFGVINVITRNGASVNGVESAATGGSQGTYSGRLTLGKRLPNGLDYLFSVSTYASAGRSNLFYKEYNSPATNNGVATNQDGDRYWSVLGKVSYEDFTLQAGYVTREKNVPTGSYGTVFNAPNTTVDSRGYIELRYAHKLDNGWSLTGKAYYDLYDFTEAAFYNYGAGPVLNDNPARARWWGLETGASKMFWNKLRLSFGADFRDGTVLKESDYDVNPYTSYANVSAKQMVIGTFAESTWDITKSLSLSGGVRWDHYDSFGSTVNPRGAMIWKPREGTTLKLLYGQAFRAPNINQLDYAGTGQLANPALRPETIRTYEFEAQQQWGRHWHGTLSLYRNDISDLITTDMLPNGLTRYDNLGNARVLGAETEIEGKWDSGLALRASYARQNATDTMTGMKLVNSPQNVAKLRVSVPVWSDKIFGSVELLYTSDRLTLTHQPTGDTWLLNATIFSRKLARSLECSASVYNILNQKYRTPGGTEHLQDMITQDGTTFLFKIQYRF